MHKYDAVWILSSNNPDKKTLTDINVSRLERGLEIYRSKQAEKVALSGSASDEMLDYLIENGVGRENIYHETLSRDTVANVIAFELTIRRFCGWKSIVLVSSKYHLKRVEDIIGKLYPGKFNLETSGVPCNGNNSRAWEEHEMSSLQDFYRDFGDVSSGNDFEIIRRLVDVHQEYKNRPDKNNLRGMLMRALQQIN